MVEKMSTPKKLKERCDVLSTIVSTLYSFYHDPETSHDQRKFVETIIGAGIFYLPHSQRYWTGKISAAALTALKENPRARLTKEHQYPRKLAARDLFAQPVDNQKVLEL